MNYGFRVSQSGYDVKTATDPQLVVSSKYNSYKIPTTLQGSSTLSINSFSQATLQITHSLGYIPAWDAWYKDDGGNWHSVFEQDEVAGVTSINATDNPQVADSTTIKITLTNSSGGTLTATIYYIIFLESIN